MLYPKGRPKKEKRFKSFIERAALKKKETLKKIEIQLER